MGEKNEKTTGEKLWKTFKKVAKVGLFTAFSFAVMGGLDFIFFHELAEGAAFIDAIRPVGEAVLTGNIPILNASISDGLLNAAELISGATAAPVSEASVFTEAVSPMVGNAW